MIAVVDLESRLRAAWRPPPRLSLSTWADANFRLPEGDANAGPWRTLPYQRGIMDAISDSGIERVCVMKSARVGYTKCFCAAVGYYIEHDPAPIMIVQPTIDDAKKHSKEDIAPMLRDVPVLRGLVAEPKTRDSDNTILDKLFKGGSLSLVGANSPRGFRRTSRRVVIFDEVDGYPPSAGTEGDQLELGIRRTEYYWNRKIVFGSTPTIQGLSRIERLFEDGDQRRYYVPCPSCGAFQVLKFPNLQWPQGNPQAAWFLCESRGCTIEHRAKRDLVEAGEWRPEAPDHFTPDHRHASFHLWAAYSYSPNATWGQIAAEHVAAVHGGPLTHRTFVNTVLGQTWQERGDAPAYEPLVRRRESYRIGTCPVGVCFLTVGVDIQKDRLVAEVVGWGRGKTSWSIDYVTIPGDTSDLGPEGPWGRLDALLGRRFPLPHGDELPITMAAVDSGYNSQQVYAWSRRHPMSRVIVVKGQARGGALVSAPQPIEVTGHGRRLKRGAKVWPVVGSYAKGELYGWLRLEDPAAPGYCHFPEYGEDYFRELTAEQLVTHTTRGGFLRLEWELIPGRRNEALDARVYARCAASVVGLDRFTASDWAALERARGSAPPQPARAAIPSGPQTLAPGPQTSAPGVPALSKRTPWLTARPGWLR